MSETNENMAEGIDDVVDLTDETAPPAEDVPEQPDEASEAGDAEEPDEEPDETSKAGREAAKYRRRLRETEAERDALAQRVTDLQRSVVDGIVTARGEGGGRLYSAEPFWAGGVDLDTLLDDEGRVDTTKVLEAADDVARRFGITRRARPLHIPGEGVNPPVRAGDSMRDVVMGRGR